MVGRAELLAQISALLDNELPDKDALTIKKHLLSCELCRSEFEKLKKIDRLLNEWDRHATECIKTSDSYSERLCQRIRAMKERAPASRRKQITNRPLAEFKTTNPAAVLSHIAFFSCGFSHSYNFWNQTKDFPHFFRIF